jgi:hypothetical protein
VDIVTDVADLYRDASDMRSDTVRNQNWRKNATSPFLSGRKIEGEQPVKGII